MKTLKKLMERQLYLTKYELERYEKALNHEIKLTKKDIDCLDSILGVKNDDLQWFLEQEGLLEK